MAARVCKDNTRFVSSSEAVNVFHFTVYLNRLSSFVTNELDISTNSDKDCTVCGTAALLYAADALFAS